MSTNVVRKRCCSCNTVLTSEDKHRFGVNCEICEEDTWYYEHFDYVPFHTIWRYVCYQLRWLRFSMPPDWVYACARCCAGWMRDDNQRMYGGGDEEN